MSTKVKSYTDEQLLNRVKELDSFFVIPENRWIIGVRAHEDSIDIMDDKFYEFEGQKFIRVLTGTTNPGGAVLKGGFRRFNKYGAAVLKGDQWYYNVWKYGLHRGKMPALRQVGAKVTVYRDGNMNGKSEEIGKPIMGWYGINYHSNTYDFSKKNRTIKKWRIGWWSAGCQVINDREKYYEQMQYYKEALKSGKQEYVSYCLLNEF